MPRARRKPSNPIETAKVHDISPTTVQRIMTEAKRGAADPRLGSQIGRLYLGGQITEPQFRAGTRFAELRRRWRSVQGIRQPSAQSAKIGQVLSGSSEVDDNVAMALSAADASARAAIVDTPGVDGRRAFDLACNVCELDEAPVGFCNLLLLRAALSALAIHWEPARRTSPGAALSPGRDEVRA